MENLTPRVRRRFEEEVFKHLGIQLAADDAIWSPAREVIVTGGWRGGKSVRAAARALRAALNPKTSLIWLLGPDYIQARQEFLYLLDWCYTLDLVQGRPSMPTEGQCTLRLKTGCVIMTKSAKYPERLGAVAPDGIVLCEPGQMPEEVYVMVIGRLAQKRGWLFASGTIEDDSTHPRWVWFEDLARHWLTHKIGQLCPEGCDTADMVAYSLPSWANLIVYPLGEQDPEIQRQREKLSEYEFNRRIAGLPVGIEHPCFPVLWETDSEHEFLGSFVAQEYIDGAIGVDFGSSENHPSAVAVVQLGVDGIYYVQECWTEVGGSLDEIEATVEAFKRRYLVYRGRVDPNQHVLAERLGFNIALGGTAHGIPSEFRIGIANGLMRDYLVAFNTGGKGVKEAFQSMRRMRRKPDRSGRLMYWREIGDDQAQSILYALEELHADKPWLPRDTNFGSMRFTYETFSRPQLAGRM